MRRVGEALSADNDLDAGFRMLMTDTTNMADVSTTVDALGQGELVEMVDSVKSDRTDVEVPERVFLVDPSGAVTRTRVRLPASAPLR